MGIFHIAKRAK